jgi:lysophospholipase L1-like esterase
MFCKNYHRVTGFSLSLGFALALLACSEDGTTPAGGTAGTGTATTTSPATGAAGAATGGAGSGTAVGAAGASAAGASGKSSSGAAGAPAAGSSGAGAGATAGTAGDAAGTGGDVMSAAGSSGSAAGASGGAGGAAAGSGGDAGAPAMPMDQGKGDGTDVITIGDSWMNILTNGGGIEGGLDRAGTKYRHYAVAGTTLIGGDIPAQYDRAKAANPKIKTVIMTGGGNDVMFSNGCATKEACTMFAQKIADALDELWTKMADDGVTTTVYIQYSAAAGTAPKDTRPDMSPTPKICLTGKIKCLSIPTTDLIAATDLIDGIHPTSAGCDRIAKATLAEMDKNGSRR